MGRDAASVMALLLIVNGFDGARGRRRAPRAKDHARRAGDFTGGERLALDLVKALHVEKELRPEQHAQLAGVELGAKHVLEFAQQVAKIRRKRIEIADLASSDPMALS